MAVHRIVHEIQTVYGLRSKPEQIQVIAANVKRRADLLGTSVEEAVPQILSNKKWLQEVAQALLIGETFFFRQRPHLDYIVNQLKQSRLKREGQPFRVLSAGCANGAEPYSLAISFMEAGILPREYEIVACDVSSEAIEIAQIGVYGSWSFRDFPPHIWQRYFRSASSTSWEIVPAVRSSVSFTKQSIQEFLRLCTPESFHAILCRNVTVYFHKDALESVYSAFARALRTDGRFLCSPTDPRPSGALIRTKELDATVFCKTEREKEKTSKHPAAPQPLTAATPPTKNVGKPAERKSPTRVDSLSAESINRIRMLANQGEYAAALEMLKPWCQKKPYDCRIGLLRGQIYMAKGQKKEAVTLFEQCLKWTPSDSLIRFWYLLALWETGHNEKALEEAGRLTNFLGNQPPHTCLSDEQTTVGELHYAVQQIEQELQ